MTNKDTYIPKYTIACPKCGTIKLIRYWPREKENENKFESCWACNESRKTNEWETLQQIPY